MSFKFSGWADDDGSWSLDVRVPDGGTVTKGDVIDRVLVPALAQLTLGRSVRIPTEAEQAAMVERARLPEGWEVTLAGQSSTNGEWHREYTRDGVIVTAPCDVNGNPTPATRAALLVPSPEA